jgi:uncharacterized membrane protein
MKALVILGAATVTALGVAACVAGGHPWLSAVAVGWFGVVAGRVSCDPGDYPATEEG